MSTRIDADGHITEPAAVWQEYTEPAYRDRVIQVRRNAQGDDDVWIGGEPRPRSNPSAACIPGAMADTSRRYTWDDTLAGGYDPARRLEVLAEEGLDQALLFPSIYLLYGDIDDPALAAATCRAYNDWMADFCRAAPGRLFGVGIVPLQDVGRAVEETRRIARLGLRAALIRPERFRGLALEAPACEPFFAELEDCDLALAVHGSFGSQIPGFAQVRYANPFFVHMVCHPFEQMAACLDLVCGGVLSKFPRLRVGFFESGLGWLRYWLDRMDEHFDTMRRHTPWLRVRPSETFRAQCFISMDPDDGPELARLAERDLARCVVWGSDYPHYDCVYPGARAALEQSCSEVSPATLAAVLHENPRRYMGLAGG